MVQNILMKCEICNSVIQFKWQIGHFERTPVSIVCPECKTILKFVLIANQRDITTNLESRNVTNADVGEVPKYFVETSSELLTQKISDEMIFPGWTPFIRTSSMLGEDRFQRFQAQVSKGMYGYSHKLHRYERLNDLYYNNSGKYFVDDLLKNSFIKNVGQDISNIGKTDYLFNYNMNFYKSFLKERKIDVAIKEIDRLFINLRQDNDNEYERFLKNYFSEEMIVEYEKRVYRSANAILNNYPYLLPATMLNYFSSEKREKIYEDLSITTTNFVDVKDIYISIYENLMVVYEVIVLLNNIMERGSYEKFDQNIQFNGRAISTINQFSRLSKGHRLQFLESRNHFNIIMPDFDRKIRNAIGHELWDYEPLANKVLFEHDEMYVLEFVFRCWSLFENVVEIYRVLYEIKRDWQQIINNFS